MLKLLLKEFNSIQISLAPLTFIILNGLSFKMKLYGLKDNAPNGVLSKNF